ncbi:hypothetical protein Pmani_038313 [Petrolisthes manimaculis]|uniref:Uncharacterized protein n=1 Tax=Petrolisthes manimaculis TaxID=1843537 RepID=A0AAE1NGM8_9EUCA|nr:hypothetical protein Pmani_038313 [Petrolisthes manimaculis]
MRGENEEEEEKEEEVEKWEEKCVRNEDERKDYFSLSPSLLLFLSLTFLSSFPPSLPLPHLPYFSSSSSPSLPSFRSSLPLPYLPLLPSSLLNLGISGAAVL